MWILVKCLAAVEDSKNSTSAAKAIVHKFTSEHGAVERFYRARTCYIEVAVEVDKDKRGDEPQLRSQRLWFCKPVQCDYITKESKQDVRP